MYLLTNLLNYLAIVVSAAGATVESTTTAVESVATAVESAFTATVLPEPHATNVAAIAKIAITFFILFVLLFKFKYTLIGITYYTKYRVIEFLYSKGTSLSRSLT
jgi:hypothetical protein